MTCSVNRTCHQSPAHGDRPRYWPHWPHFLKVNYIYLGRQYIYILFNPFPCIRGGGNGWIGCHSSLAPYLMLDNGSLTVLNNKLNFYEGGPSSAV